MNLEFSRQIFGEKKNLKYLVSSKSVQWEPNCSMRIDGRTDTDGRTDRLTDITKLIIAFLKSDLGGQSGLILNR
jgi:hypothetical protein